MVNIAHEPFLKRYRVALIGVPLLLGIGLAGGYKLYKIYQPPRLAQQARVFIDKRDYINASLVLQRARKLNPEDVTCTQLIAEVTESLDDPSAVAWRSRLVEYQPGSLQAVLDCARVALRFNNRTAAENALRNARELGQNSAQYHALFSKVAAENENFNLAVEHAAAALRLEPQNSELEMDHADVLLSRGWLEDRAPARATLDRLRMVPQFHARALRALLRDSTKQGEMANALELARELATNSAATFEDRHSLLTMLRRTRAPDLGTQLDLAKAAVRGNPIQMGELAMWMNQNGYVDQTLAWSQEFTSEEWVSPKLCLAVAICALSKKDWATLESLTRTGEWKAYDILRSALLARALRERGNRTGSQTQWDAAVAAAAKQRNGTAKLVKFIANWGWEDEMEKLLRPEMSHPTLGPWAAQALLPRLVGKKDTAGLWQATRRLLDANPENDALANNLAMYSLLLGRDVNDATEMARKLYEKHAREAEYVSTYAYALHIRGQNEDAVKLMAALDPKALQAPGVAMYYGMFLTAQGDEKRARPFLDLARPGELLPEESEALRRARGKLDLLALTPTAAEQPVEFLRVAALAKALRDKGDLETSRAQWSAAAQMALGAPHGAAELVKYISNWGWDNEMDDLLRSAMDDKVGAWACRTLIPRLLAKNDTAGLWHATRRLYELEPKSDPATLDFVRYSLLLDKDVAEVTQLAQTLHSNNPKDPQYVSVYAYSLHLHGRTPEAINLIGTLDPAGLKEPRNALFCGLIFAAAGVKDRARELVELTASKSLLPEETTLADRARAKLAEEPAVAAAK
jgi:predicted Zn-dependent protease